MDFSRLLQGDRRAWRKFIVGYGPVIYSAVVRTLNRYGIKDSSEYEDLTQEVFLRLSKDGFRLLRQYDGAKSSLTTWLMLVSRSVVLDSLKKHRLSTVGLEEAGEIAAPATDPVRPLVFPEGILSTRQQLVLRLSYERDLTPREIAAVLGIGEQTVRSMRHKALQKMREFFSASGGCFED